MAATLLSVTDRTFAEQVLQADRPVLVEFGAPWCPPCRVIAPILEELARTFENDIVIVTVDSDENPRARIEYGVMALPTIVVFRHGQVVDQLVGARPKAFYAAYIRELIGHAEAVRA